MTRVNKKTCGSAQLGGFCADTLSMKHRIVSTVQSIVLGITLQSALQTANVRSLAAQERREPLLQEFLLAESVAPQTHREFQFTLASRGTWLSGQRLLRSSVAIEYGLSDWWEIDAGVSAFSAMNLGGVATDRGMRDVSLGLRRFWSTLQDKQLGIAAGIEALYRAPVTTFDERAALVLEPSLVLGYEVESLGYAQIFGGMALEQNYVLTSQGGDDDEGTELAWNAGFVAPLGRALLLFEVTNESGRGPFGVRESIVIAPALALPFSDGWEVALGGVIGIQRPRPVDLVLILTYEP